MNLLKFKVETQAHNLGKQTWDMKSKVRNES